MKSLIIMIALLLATAGSFAAEKDIDKESEKSSKAATEQKITDQEIDKKQKAPQWPRPYKLTEEISVDNSVPFPTDI